VCELWGGWDGEGLDLRWVCLWRGWVGFVGLGVRGRVWCSGIAIAKDVQGNTNPYLAKRVLPPTLLLRPLQGCERPVSHHLLPSLPSLSVSPRTKVNTSRPSPRYPHTSLPPYLLPSLPFLSVSSRTKVNTSRPSPRYPHTSLPPYLPPFLPEHLSSPSPRLIPPHPLVSTLTSNQDLRSIPHAFYTPPLGPCKPPKGSHTALKQKLTPSLVCNSGCCTTSWHVLQENPTPGTVLKPWMSCGGKGRGGGAGR